MDAVYWYFNRSSPELHWEQESQLQLIIHLCTKALFIMTPARTHLNFAILQIIILGHTLSMAECVPRQIRAASTFSGHTNGQLPKKTPVWEFGLSRLLLYLWCGAFWPQSSFTVWEMHGQIPTLGEIFQLLEKQWAHHSSVPHLLNEMCVMS